MIHYGSSSVPLALDVIIPPPFEPITLEEVYLHLRLTPFDSPPGHPDDPMLRLFIKAARLDAENFTRRAFIEQTLRLRIGGTSRLTRSCWGGANTFEEGPLNLPRGNILGLASVRYWDGDNADQLIDPTSYYEAGGTLAWGIGYSLPALYGRPDALRIEFRAGYAPIGSPPVDVEDYRANVPEDIRAALLIGVQLLYDELTPEKRRALEMARDSLLSSYVIHTIA